MLKWNHYALIAVLSVGATSLASAQELSIGLGAGYAGFSMESLSRHMKSYQASQQVEGEIVESFPAFYSYHVNFSRTYLENKLMFTALAGHTSTGGRFYYSDYSGFLSYDNLIRMTYTGMQGFYKLKEAGGIDFYAGVQALIYYNQLELTETQYVDHEGLTTSGARFSSFNFSAAPMVQLRKQFGRLSVYLQGGYEFHVPGKLRFYDNRDAYLIHNNGDAVRVNADGIRVNGGLAFTVKRY